MGIDLIFRDSPIGTTSIETADRGIIPKLVAIRGAYHLLMAEEGVLGRYD